MRKIWIAALLAVLFLTQRRTDGLADTVEKWLTPGPGTLDMLEMTTREGIETHLAEPIRITGVQFYLAQLLQKNLLPPDYSLNGSNTYEAFHAQATFFHLKRYEVKVIAEAGVIKKHYCSPVGARMAVYDSLAGILNVEADGGKLYGITMDEPLTSTSDQCRSLSEPSRAAERVALYMKEVKALRPQTKIGLVEAYPFNTWANLVRFVDYLILRGHKLDWFHLDVNVNAKYGGLIPQFQEIQWLAGEMRNRSIPFGVILNGDDPTSDFLYAEGFMARLELLQQVYPNWEELRPEHLIFQSWAQTNPDDPKKNLAIVPRNLDWKTPASHLNLVWVAVNCLYRNERCDESFR